MILTDQAGFEEFHEIAVRFGFVTQAESAAIRKLGWQEQRLIYAEWCGRLAEMCDEGQRRVARNPA